MFEAILLALLVPLVPLGLIAFIVVLGSRGGRTTGHGFIAGWLVSATLVAVVTVWLAGHQPSRDSSTPVAWTGVVQVVLGLVVLVIALRRRRNPPPAQAEKKTPRVLTGIDGLGLVGAAVLGAMIQPWGMLAVADASALRSVEGEPARALALAVVVIAAAVPLILLSLLTRLRPEQTARRLAALRAWIEGHQRVAVNALLLVLALWLVFNGLTVLVAALA